MCNKYCNKTHTAQKTVLTFRKPSQNSFRSIRTSLDHLGMTQTCMILYRVIDRKGLPPSQVHSRIYSWISCTFHVYKGTKESKTKRLNSQLRSILSGTFRTITHPIHNNRVYRWRLVCSRCFRSNRLCTDPF